MRSILTLSFALLFGATVAVAAGGSKFQFGDFAFLPAQLQVVIAQSLGLKPGRADGDSELLAERLANDPSTSGDEAAPGGPMHVSMVAPIYYSANLIEKILDDVVASPGDMLFEMVKSVEQVEDSKWMVESDSCRFVYDVEYKCRFGSGPVGSGSTQTFVTRNEKESECNRPTREDYLNCARTYTCIQGSAAPKWNWKTKAFSCKCQAINPALPQ